LLAVFSVILHLVPVEEGLAGRGRL
jgi:hypothetical protein